MSLFLSVSPEEFLPAGEYYVGDPCYFVPDKEWDNFCDSLFLQDNKDSITISILGHKCQCQHTMYGDGSYLGDNGIEYDVDAGLLGAVPKALCQNTSDYKKKYLKTFDEPFAVVFDEESESILYINQNHSILLSILVGDEEEEDEDTLWGEEEDEDYDDDEEW